MTSLTVSVTIDLSNTSLSNTSNTLSDVIDRKGKNVQGRTCTKSHI